VSGSGVTNSVLGDCDVLPNFYVSAANTVAICQANSYCPGGGSVSMTGGAFPCTANSTIEVCNTFLDNIQSNSYAAGATTTNVAAAPAAAAPAVTTTVAAPAVTVAAPAVTVSPASQPITINVTIPAPVVSAASSRSSALVLVLAALAALAAF